jgi:hypothetical protein
MILYKYFPSQRMDVLQNLKIRFSQPYIYNDPFEVSPILTSELTESIFDNIMPVLIEHHGGTANEIAEIRAITYADFQNNQNLVLSLIQQVWACGHLVLCLTEIPDDLLMWAHYAGSHSGFVVGVDAEHGVFTCPNKTYWPKKVIYSEKRPIVNISDFNAVDAYFTKSIHWQYEKEWRVFRRPVSVQSSRVDDNQFPIYLFDLPADAIKEIILGCRMAHEDQELIREFAKKHLPHVIIKRVELSTNTYRLFFLWIFKFGKWKSL